ncbi:MAG: response regulator transcription factor [Planctomycetes bacterium]|nr:response regulator transcription factor [Planctomycetota bacterium]
MAAKSTGKFHLLIVDWQPLTRLGLVTLFGDQPNFKVVGDAGDFETAVGMVQRFRPEGVVIGLGNDWLDALALVREVVDFDKAIRIVICSPSAEEWHVEELLRAGAHGCVSKWQPTELIVHTVQAVLAGKTRVSDAVAGRLMQYLTGAESQCGQEDVAVLSDRELEVFGRLGQGATVAEIAEKMGISPKTVETFRARIRQKLAIPDNSKLIRAAVEWDIGRGAGNDVAGKTRRGFRVLEDEGEGVAATA